jgi:G6PDH family F420-dependent oxidoreductase
MEFGYFLSSEEKGPGELVDLAIRAEQAGFDEVWISDHFHPWTDRQGHAPFVWSVLGAIARTTDLTVTTAVTCPTIRTHPAIVAHAAATVAVMSGGRFRLGVGSGENLNEHVLGDGWPEAPVRLAMLEEAVEVIRQLWAGGFTSFQGEFYTVENARIYDLPDEPPPIFVSAFGPKAAAVAGRIGDGMVSTSPDREVLGVFDKNGGAGKPRHAGAKVCWGPDEGAARRLAHELWATSSIPGEANQELPSPKHFEQVAQLVTEEQVAAKTPCGPDPERFVEQFARYRDAGFDRLFVNQIGPDQDGFFEFFDRELRPLFS